MSCKELEVAAASSDMSTDRRDKYAAWDAESPELSSGAIVVVGDMMGDITVTIVSVF